MKARRSNRASTQEWPRVAHSDRPVNVLWSGGQHPVQATKIHVWTTHSAGTRRPIGPTDCLITMTPLDRSRRSFLRTSVALAGTTPLIAGSLQARSDEAGGPLIAYVGTFSSPLRDVLPTQVDLPPGNGRGIHLFDPPSWNRNGSGSSESDPGALNEKTRTEV
jgi:hypothetical protein